MSRTLLSLLVLAAGCASGTPSRPRDGGIYPRDAVISTTCGNDTIEGMEECDNANFGGVTCVSLGYASGDLSCTGECLIDKTNCVEETCGNGMLDSGEECDGVALGGQTCEARGFVGGTLGCNTDCSFDTAQCTTCGNGTIDTGEECDMAALGTATCMMRGFTGGALACDASCGIDESGCVNANCGNGTREDGEDCDMGDLGGTQCSGVGFFAGTLGCSADCRFDVANCHNCGNARIEGIEQCDGTALGTADCTTLGFTMGTLGCTAGCVYDTSGCSTAACGNGRLESGEACDDGNTGSGDGCASCAVEGGWTCSGTPSICTTICGDNMVVGGEECDGTNLAGQSCIGRGFTGGTLACASCSIVTSGCTTTGCGNSRIESGEECDDGNTTAFDGCSSTCQVDATFHLPVRLRNGEGSNHGMLEVLYQGSWRDVCDDTYDVPAQQAMANVVCRQLGYTGTGHQWLMSFGGGSGTPIMDDVYCAGTEASLAQCPFRGWGIENCGPSEAVGIRCMPGEGDVRLVGGPSGMEGRLQIYHSGAWGEVCDDYFDGFYGSSYYGYSTTTVCQQLGYANGTFVSTYDAPSSTFALDDVNCTGTERRIADCPHLPWGSHNCSASEGAGFRCATHQEGDLRLIDGTARNSGRIEILHNGIWGTVCDDYVTLVNARQANFLSVVCGQLGFERMGTGLTLSSVPDGVDPTWMDDLDCAGSETSLGSCPFNGWGIDDCSHVEDMGASCAP